MSIKLVLPQLWLQRKDESDADYAKFLTWLQHAQEQPHDPGLAVKYDWARRATAFDQHQANAAPQRRLQRLSENLLALVDLETQKLLQSSESTGAHVLSVREVVQVLAYLKDAALLEKCIDDEGDLDLSKLSNEELRTLQKGAKLMGKL